MGQREDVELLMRTSDVMLHMAHQEPLGRVLLESFASGLPTVATRVGGTAEIFCDDLINHLMVDAGDFREAAERVVRLLESVEQRRAVSKIQRQIAASHRCSSAA